MAVSESFETKGLKIAVLYGPGERHVNINFKAWVYEDNVVAWELRRFLWELFYTRKSVRTSNEIRVLEKFMKGRFETMGMRWSQELFPSRSSARMDSESAMLSQYTRDQGGVSPMWNLRFAFLGFGS